MENMVTSIKMHKEFSKKLVHINQHQLIFLNTTSPLQ